MSDYEAGERRRWSYMTEEQLLIRVQRISIREKLNCFIQIAATRRSHYLLQAGFDRWNSLFMARHPLERVPIEERLANIKPKLEKVEIIHEPEFRMIR